jgi:uncharacterized RDD family membrane protein YckC
MAFCENCGRELSDQAVMCPNCGHPRSAAAVTTVGQATGYAEWWQRAVAYIVDGIIVAVPAWIIMAIASVGFVRNTTVTRDQSGDLTINSGALGRIFVGLGIILLIGILYRVLMEGSPRGQTVGKMAMKIAVKDAETGGPIGYGRAFARWVVASILWIAFYLPGILDLLFPLWDQRKQTLHDKAVRSVVVQVS